MRWTASRVFSVREVEEGLSWLSRRYRPHFSQRAHRFKLEIETEQTWESPSIFGTRCGSISLPFPKWSDALLLLWVYNRHVAWVWPFSSISSSTASRPVFTESARLCAIFGSTGNIARGGTSFLSYCIFANPQCYLVSDEHWDIMMPLILSRTIYPSFQKLLTTDGASGQGIEATMLIPCSYPENAMCNQSPHSKLLFKTQLRSRAMKTCTQFFFFVVTKSVPSTPLRQCLKIQIRDPILQSNWYLP